MRVNERAELLGLIRQELRHWLWAWHRVAICRMRYPRDMLSEAGVGRGNIDLRLQQLEPVLAGNPTFRLLRRHCRVMLERGRAMAQDLAAGRDIGIVCYDQFLDTAFSCCDLVDALIGNGGVVEADASLGRSIGMALPRLAEQPEFMAAE